jgi:hypothetical protein
MSRLVPFASGVALLLLLLATVTGSARSQEPDPFHLAYAKVPGGVVGKSGHTAWKSELLLHRLEPRFGAQTVRRVRCERGVAEGPFHCQETVESTSFLITAFAARAGGHDVFVAGVRADLSCVIERWTSPVRRGGWSVSVAAPPSMTVGFPAPPVSFVQQPFQTSSWQPLPTSGPGLPALGRSELLSWPVGPITAMAADPEGRFLLFYDLALQSLFRLDLAGPSAQPVFLLTVADVPTLDQVGFMEFHDFEGEGRKCLIRRCYESSWTDSAESYLILSDAENDGIFESRTVLSHAPWKSSPYGDWSKWRLFTVPAAP